MWYFLHSQWLKNTSKLRQRNLHLFFLCSVCNAIIRLGWRFIFLCIWPPGVWAGKPILRCCNIFVEQSKDTIIGSEILSKLQHGLCDLKISIFIIFIGPRFDPCPPLTHWLGQSLLSFRLDWCDPGFDAFFSETTPRCMLVANAGGRPFCHELGMGWVHVGQWIFSISALSHELFWRNCVFVSLHYKVNGSKGVFWP